MTLTNTTVGSSELVLYAGRTEYLGCVTGPTRPATEIEWKINTIKQTNVINRNDSISSMYTVTSILTVNVDKHDNGKTLYCGARVGTQPFMYDSTSLNIWCKYLSYSIWLSFKW